MEREALNGGDRIASNSLELFITKDEGLDLDWLFSDWNKIALKLIVSFSMDHSGWISIN